MVRDLTAQRGTDERRGHRGAARPSGRFDGIAYAVFAAAFAVGTLIHEFQSTIVWWVAVPVGVAALAVLLRPASPARLVLLLVALALECVAALPDPINHQVLMGILGLTLGPWWLWLRLRDPAAAADPAVMWRRVTPYLRVSFIVLWYAAAVAKLNTGFLDVAATCSKWILESIPFVHVPAALVPPVIGGTIVLELSIPTLLLLHRTRPFAIVVAFGFHLVSAFAGHSSFSGFAWSMYVLFLPPVLLARCVVTVRRSLPETVRGRLATAAARPWSALAVLAAVWMAGRYGVMELLPAGLRGGARHWGAVLLCVTFMVSTGWVLVRLRRHWLPARGPRASLRVTSVLMLVGIGLVLFTAATPYLGLKTRAAFTMFSNVRTEPGHWNHLLLPEWVRVFGWQDGGEVDFLDTDDPALARKIAANEAERVPLLGARRLVDEFPDATVRYRLDGVEHVAAPVSSDPVLGAPLTTAQELFGAIRPYADRGACQH